MRPVDKNKLKEKFHSSEELIKRYVGPKGSPERTAMEIKAKAWFYGEILRDCHRDLKMSQATLAKKVGMKQSFIARVEKARSICNYLH